MMNGNDQDDDWHSGIEIVGTSLSNSAMVNYENNNNKNSDENFVGEEDETVAEPIRKPYVGMIFETIEDSHKFWEKYARDTGFRPRIRSSKRKEDGTIATRSYVCSKEGTTCEDPRRIPHKRRPPKRCGCGVIMTVNLVKGTKIYRISSFIEEHNHDTYGPTSEEGHISKFTSAQSVCKPIVGMEFDTIEASQAFWERYAYDVGFHARIRSSKRKGDGVVRTRMYVCSKEGKKCVRRGGTRCGCGAQMIINWVKKKGTYRVSSFIEEHNHVLDGIDEGPLDNFSKEEAFEINNELDDEQNTISGVREHEDEGEINDMFAPNGPLDNLVNAQRMGILCSEFTQLAYRAVGNNEVFEGVRRLIREGHSLADKYKV